MSEARKNGKRRIAAIVEKAPAAPPWLVKRMKALRQMPPPTLQEVETSFRSAEAMRSNYDGSPNGFGNWHGKRVR